MRLARTRRPTALKRLYGKKLDILLLASLTIVLSAAGAGPNAVELEVASPSGRHVVVKRYSENGRTDLEVTLVSRDHVPYWVDTTVLYNGFYKSSRFGSDGFLVGWEGESDLVLGLPVGSALPANTALGSVNVRWVSYDHAGWLERAKIVPVVRLEQSSVFMEHRQLPGDYVDCSISVKGVNPDSGSMFTVTLLAVGRGLKTESSRGQLQGSLDVEITPATKDRSNFSLQQIAMDGIDLWAPLAHGSNLLTLEQRTNLIRYSGFEWYLSADILRLLVQGGFHIYVNYSFGRRIENLRFETKMSLATFREFRACESSTNIFPGSISGPIPPPIE